MTARFRTDALLGFFRDGLWLAQFVTAAVLLGGFFAANAPFGAPLAGSSPTTTVTLGVVLVGLVGCHTLVSTLLLTTRGFPSARSTGRTGGRIVEAVVVCVAVGVAALAVADVGLASARHLTTLAAAAYRSRFDVAVVVLAAVVVAHAVGTAAFAAVADRT